MTANEVRAGSQIRAARALLGWSQRDLAEAAGLHRSSVGYREAGARIRLKRDEYAVFRTFGTLQAAGATFSDEPLGVALQRPESASGAFRTASTRARRARTVARTVLRLRAAGTSADRKETTSRGPAREPRRS